MLTTISLILNFVQLFIIIFLIRYIWYLIAYGSYINLVKLYLFENKLDFADYSEYIQVWPLTSVLIRFWDFKFVNYVVNHDFYYKVINYYAEKYMTQNTNKHDDSNKY